MLCGASTITETAEMEPDWPRHLGQWQHVRDSQLYDPSRSAALYNTVIADNSEETEQTYRLVEVQVLQCARGLYKHSTFYALPAAVPILARRCLIARVTSSGGNALERSTMLELFLSRFVVRFRYQR